MNSADHKTNNSQASPKMAPEADHGQKLNELAQAKLQELGMMCQRQRGLQDEMAAVKRRIDELNSEIQGIGAAFGVIAETAPDVPQLSRVQ
jgi:hypothetical protein